MSADGTLGIAGITTHSVADIHLASRFADDPRLETVADLPVQLSAPPDWRALARGEVALCAAILADAIECFYAYAESRDVERRRLARQAERWLFGNPRDAPFSMQCVCDALGVDAERVRRSIAARVGSPASGAPAAEAPPPFAQGDVRRAGRRRLRN